MKTGGRIFLVDDDELIVTIAPLRNGQPGGLLVNVTTTDGIPVGGRP